MELDACAGWVVGGGWWSALGSTWSTLRLFVWACAANCRGCVCICVCVWGWSSGSVRWRSRIRLWKSASASLSVMPSLCLALDCVTTPRIGELTRCHSSWYVSGSRGCSCDSCSHMRNPSQPEPRSHGGNTWRVCSAITSVTWLGGRLVIALAPTCKSATIATVARRILQTSVSPLSSKCEIRQLETDSNTDRRDSRTRLICTQRLMRPDDLYEQHRPSDPQHPCLVTAWPGIRTGFICVTCTGMCAYATSSWLLHPGLLWLPTTSVPKQDARLRAWRVRHRHTIDRLSLRIRCVVPTQSTLRTAMRHAATDRLLHRPCFSNKQRATSRANLSHGDENAIRTASFLSDTLFSSPTHAHTWVRSSLSTAQPALR